MRTHTQARLSPAGGPQTLHVDAQAGRGGAGLNPRTALVPEPPAEVRSRDGNQESPSPPTPPTLHMHMRNREGASETRRGCASPSGPSWTHRWGPPPPGGRVHSFLTRRRKKCTRRISGCSNTPACASVVRGEVRCCGAFAWVCVRFRVFACVSVGIYPGRRRQTCAERPADHHLPVRRSGSSHPAQMAFIASPCQGWKEDLKGSGGVFFVFFVFPFPAVTWRQSGRNDSNPT